MATFRSYSTKDQPGSSNSKVTCPAPAGMAAGDVIIAVGESTAAFMKLPSGFVQVDPGVNGFLSLVQGAWRKVVTAADVAAGQFTWEVNQTPHSTAMLLLCYSNANLTTPVDGAAHAGPGSGTSSAVAASLTPSDPNDVLLTIVLSNSASATPPAGMTERVDFLAAANGIDFEANELTLSGTSATGTKTSTTASAGTWMAFSILLRGATPAAPTLSSPNDGDYLNAAGGLTAAWTHNGQNGGTQTAYALKRKTTGADEWWNAGTGLWQGTEVFNSSTAGSLTFAAAKWTNGNAYSWAVATQDANGTSPYSGYRVLNANTAPVTSVTAPSGTSGASRPDVTWTYTDSESNPQIAYRVKVFDQATYTAGGFDPATSTPVWDSGDVAGTATTATVGVDLVNGGTYRAYERSSQVGGMQSGWAYSEWTVALDAPAVPTLVAVWDSTLARCALAVQGRDNLLSLNQSSLETDTSGWFVGANCTLARSTVQAANGSASLSMTAVAGANMSAGASSGTLVAGSAYLIVASARAAVTARQVGVRIDWTGASGYISTATGVATADNTAGWRQAALVAVAPAGATGGNVVVTIFGASAGEVHYVDRVGIIPLGDTDEYGYGTNLLDNGGFENGTDGWSAAAGSAATSTSKAYIGRTSLANAVSSSVTYPGLLSGVNVVAGVTYTLSAWVLNDTASQNVYLQAQGTAIPAGVNSNPQPVAALNTWERRTLTFTPTATGNVNVGVYRQGTITTGTIYIDAVKLEKGSTATPFVPRSWSNLLDQNPSMQTVTNWKAFVEGGSNGTVFGGTAPMPLEAIVSSGGGPLPLAFRAAAPATGTSGVLEIGGGLGISQSPQVYPGQKVTASVWIKAPAGKSVDFQYAINMQDAAGNACTVPSDLSGGGALTATGDWQRVTQTFTTPANAATVQPRVRLLAPAPSDVLLAQAMQVVYGNDPLPYIDGSLGAGYSWDASENLLVPADSSFESGVGGWAGNGSTLASSTAQAYDGTHSLAATATGTGGSNGAYIVFGNLPAGTYTLSAWLRSSVAVDVTFGSDTTAGGTTVASVLSTGWVRAVRTVNHAGGAMSVVAYRGGPAIGDVLYIDAVQVEQRDHATPYGSTGAANATTSTKQAPWSRGGLSGLTKAIVEASDDGGVTWLPIRGGDGSTAFPWPSQALTLYDLEGPPSKTRQYRAKAVASV